jgi:hypothetical protein
MEPVRKGVVSAQIAMPSDSHMNQHRARFADAALSTQERRFHFRV